MITLFPIESFSQDQIRSMRALLESIGIDISKFRVNNVLLSLSIDEMNEEIITTGA
jgi:hypothetical protein